VPGAGLPTIVQILNGEKPSNTGPVLFARPLGSGFKYSGGCVTIMQLAMMDVYGRPYHELLRESNCLAGWKKLNREDREDRKEIDVA
jgi:hypothetical protein